VTAQACILCLLSKYAALQTEAQPPVTVYPVFTCTYYSVLVSGVFKVSSQRATARSAACASEGGEMRSLKASTATTAASLCYLCVVASGRSRLF
jgi:hypothetical protein